MALGIPNVAPPYIAEFNPRAKIHQYADFTSSEHKKKVLVFPSSQRFVGVLIHHA